VSTMVSPVFSSRTVPVTTISFSGIPDA
jgi:hypothetical protein